ncbi:hypothetical protein RHSP_32146 [Rhizobium freirei PRF 81]|uniref:DUF4376 domain-containing protein n=1 Tax=Rhizobium freirei PRF 81 TaxID=363754 RepID=N6V520_9HYPH|nr:hypothetical protein [Rhizobium freirei]ENN86087.1 hypothetical protein RHSP_32146 [Rhizobium freirei PRF 81]
MKLNGTDWDDAILHALGATMVSEIRDENDAITGYEVEPDIDVSSYQERALSMAKADRIDILNGACAAAILGGFQSSALGSSYSYPSAIKDQINLMGSVTDSLLPDLPNGWTTPFWCADKDGIWAFRSHDGVQIQQAGADGKAHVIDCQKKLAQLTDAVNASASLDAVAAIIWA